MHLALSLGDESVLNLLKYDFINLQFPWETFTQQKSQDDAKIMIQSLIPPKPRNIISEKSQFCH